MARHVMPEGQVLNAMVDMGLHSWIPRTALAGRRVPVSRAGREAAAQGGRSHGPARSERRERGVASARAATPIAPPGLRGLVVLGALIGAAGMLLAAMTRPR